MERETIKHLVEYGRYHYIETGSPVGIKENVKDIVIPSEEQRLTPPVGLQWWGYFSCD